MLLHDSLLIRRKRKSNQLIKKDPIRMAHSTKNNKTNNINQKKIHVLHMNDQQSKTTSDPWNILKLGISYAIFALSSMAIIAQYKSNENEDTEVQLNFIPFHPHLSSIIIFKR